MVKETKRKFIAGRKYILTIPFSAFDVKKVDHRKIKYFIGAEEIGENSGYHHLQAFIILTDRATSAKQVNNILGIPLIFNKDKNKDVLQISAIYCNGTDQQNIDYVNKMKTKPDNFYKVEFGSLEEYKKPNNNINEQHDKLINDIKSGMSYKDIINNNIDMFYNKFNQFNTLYKLYKPIKKFNVKPIEKKDWQITCDNNIFNQLDNEDQRTINIIVDVGGAAGKTTYTKILNNECIDKNIICQRLDTSKKADIAYCINEEVRVVNFDLSRSQEDRINWDAIESIKNGALFSSKYQSFEKKLDYNPVVNVFCNSLPKDLYNKISIDRCNIIAINNRGKDYKIYKFDESDELNIDKYKNLYNENNFSRPKTARNYGELLDYNNEDIDN